MSFMWRDRWHCSFLEADARTPLPRKASFADSAGMVDFARRGGCAWTSEDRQSVDRGVEIGRGAIWLDLTQDQYAKLKGT